MVDRTTPCSVFKKWSWSSIFSICIEQIEYD
jgi:hypothetical protein